MDTTSVSFRLQKGITGGFAPPTPSAVYTVDANPSQSLYKVTTAVRADGTPTLGDAVPKTLATSKGDALVEELYGILKSIPTEFPPGSEDIYHEDTSIAFSSNDFQWWNGGPQGCGGGESQVQPTEDDKAKFKRAVAIVEKLVAEAQ